MNTTFNSEEEKKKRMAGCDYTIESDMITVGTCEIWTSVGNLGRGGRSQIVGIKVKEKKKVFQ